MTVSDIEGLETSDRDPRMLRLTSMISAAYLSNNSIQAQNVADVIGSVHAALSSVGQNGRQDDPAPEPAVPVRRSITPDYLICLEDGRKLKMLKRYLKARFDMTPEEYRERWGLPPDYPMVAPNYAALRSDFARKMGLGKKSD